MIITFRQSEHGFRGEDGFPAEVWETGGTRGDGASGECGEGVEEVPEGGTIGDGVTNGATDEDAVSEVGDLKRHNR